MVPRSARVVPWSAAVAGGLAALLLTALIRHGHPVRSASARTAGNTALAAVRAIPPPAPPPPSRCPPEPQLVPRTVPTFATLPELARLVREQPDTLGSASMGSPTRGSLWGAFELEPSDAIDRAGSNPWGTETVVRSIERAVREVARCFPATPKLSVGDISRKQGGWLVPHRSHQSGLDADVGYYYSTGPGWFQTATADNLDVPRTWSLVRALYEGDNVDSIFMDRSVQLLLQRYAEKLDEDGPDLGVLFQSDPKKPSVIRHVHGHGTHFHVRFRDPAAIELGVRITAFIPGKVSTRPATRPSSKPR